MCEHTDNGQAVHTFPPPTSQYTDDDMTVLWWETLLPFTLVYTEYKDGTPALFTINTGDLAQAKVTDPPFAAALLNLLKEHGYV